MDLDVLIIGAGQASVPLAQALTKAGRRAAVAERKHLGGSCVNFGCTPTKAVIASAKLAYEARRAALYGLRIPEVEVDFAGVLERATRLVTESRESLRESFEGEDAPTLLRGHARFEDRSGGGFRVRVGETLVHAGQVVLDTGTRSLLPPIEGLGEVEVIHAGNWLEHRDLPEHLAIVGGSYIGLEMSQVYRRLGSRVTVIESDAQIASREDADVASAMQRLLGAEGISFRLGAEATRVQRRGEGLLLTLKGGETLAASHLFVASGRRPNTDDLGLETVGVTLDDKGFVEVDARLATSVAGVWAAGDVRGGPMFTHTAFDDFEVLESQLLGDGARTTERLVPYAMFTDPQLGRVGLSEKEASEAGKHVEVATYDMKKNGRAREMRAREGFVKVVVDADDGQLLGAAVLAAEGAELIHAYIDLMNAGAPYTVMNRALHIHPTLSEALKSVFKGLE